MVDVPSGAWVRHVPSSPLGESRAAHRALSLECLADDLVDAALGQASGQSHVVATEAVAQRPSQHQPVTVVISGSDSVLGVAELMHQRGLPVQGDIGNRCHGPQLLNGEQLVSMPPHAFE
jgi:hypothetical protein